MTTKTPSTPAPPPIWVPINTDGSPDWTAAQVRRWHESDIPYVPKAELDAVLALNKTQAETITDYQSHIERLAIGAINSYRRRAVEVLRRGPHHVDCADGPVETCDCFIGIIARRLLALPATAKEVADG